MAASAGTAGTAIERLRCAPCAPAAAKYRQLLMQCAQAAPPRHDCSSPAPARTITVAASAGTAIERLRFSGYAALQTLDPEGNVVGAVGMRPLITPSQGTSYLSGRVSLARGRRRTVVCENMWQATRLGTGAARGRGAGWHGTTTGWRRVKLLVLQITYEKVLYVFLNYLGFRVSGHCCTVMM